MKTELARIKNIIFGNRGSIGLMNRISESIKRGDHCDASHMLGILETELLHFIIDIEGENK